MSVCTTICANLFHVNVSENNSELLVELQESEGVTRVVLILWAPRISVQNLKVICSLFVEIFSVWTIAVAGLSDQNCSSVYRG